MSISKINLVEANSPLKIKEKINALIDETESSASNATVLNLIKKHTIPTGDTYIKVLTSLDGLNVNGIWSSATGVLKC